MPCHKFILTAFKELEFCSANTYLTGVLTTLTTTQEIKRANGRQSIVGDLSLQNLRSKINFWVARQPILAFGQWCLVLPGVQQMHSESGWRGRMTSGVQRRSRNPSPGAIIVHYVQLH
ncbi:hypothetical protein C5167_015394 [Papaver somniferum]|uniref:Uncharacterized protein n=1 Tax=Papaver somniferum TaxID=3469 RepID=A0A4Y7J9Y6_PAPSO|nr:hypothetical protein C5167_015394 [Papaver somniferum]